MEHAAVARATAGKVLASRCARQGQSTRRGMISPPLKCSTSTTWYLYRAAGSSSSSNCHRGYQLHPSRPGWPGAAWIKERNLSHAVLDSLLFTELLQPLMHVYRTWKATQSDAEPGDVGFRASIVHEVDKLVEMFVREQPREVRGATGVVRPARMRVEAKRIASSFISDASAARSAARTAE